MVNKTMKAGDEANIWEFLNVSQLVVDVDGIKVCKSADKTAKETVISLDFSEPAAVGGAVNSVRVVFNKAAFNKSVLNKNKNKNKNNNQLSGSDAGGTLIPTAPILRLHRQGVAAPGNILPFDWANIDLTPPPGPDHTRLETKALLAMQNAFSARENRREDIIRQAGLDVSDFTRPLGIDGLAGYSATEGLFLEILTVCEYVGLHYKSIFRRPRPNQVEPMLRLLLPNPPHDAYPSNHSFQSFSIAYAFNTVLPEHPATNELSIAALNVAQNREWAGLHYPSDTVAGRDLARRFAPYLAAAFSEKFQAVQEEWL